MFTTPVRERGMKNITPIWGSITTKVSNVSIYKHFYILHESFPPAVSLQIGDIV